MFVVSDVNDMNRLWREGFFGKGVLSRSEPTWCDRTQKRLGLGDFKHFTREELTALRREERKKFKKERAKLEAKQAELKKQGIVDPFIEEKLELRNMRDRDVNVKVQRETYIREEDAAILDVNNELINLEVVELQPMEVFFLKFALGAAEVVVEGEDISTHELFKLLIKDMTPEDPFILNYVAYHYYRSAGWCARSGIKFGTDLILYKRGPPLSHAEYAVCIIPTKAHDSKFNEENAHNFIHLSSLNRIIGTVKKKLLLTFIDIPTSEDFNKASNLKELFELYKISEFVYRRFVPNRNRD